METYENHLINRHGIPLTPAQQAVNASLEKDAKSMICDPGQTPDDIKSYYSQQKTVVTFVSNRLLSITLAQSQFCGGMHPSDGKISEIFDLQLGQQISISTGVPVAGTEGLPKETQAFTDIIVNAMLAQGKALVANGKLDISCKDAMTADLLADFPSVAVSPRAVIATPQLAHADTACEFSATIPLAKFAKIAKPGSLLAELVKGATKK